MIILIDGYNLLRHIFPKEKGLLEKQREQLILQLGFYWSKKKDEIKEIIVVFDAGPLRHATREIKAGVAIIFSGQKSSADEWILHYVEKHHNRDVLLVSLDRKLVQSCEEFDIVSMGVDEFYHTLKNFLMREVDGKDRKNVLSSVERYEPIDLYEDDGREQESRSALDLLMEEASLHVMQKDDDTVSQKHKRKGGTSKKLSKKKRKRYAKIKKLD